MVSAFDLFVDGGVSILFYEQLCFEGFFAC